MAMAGAAVRGASTSLLRPQQHLSQPHQDAKSSWLVFPRTSPSSSSSSGRVLSAGPANSGKNGAGVVYLPSLRAVSAASSALLHQQQDGGFVEAAEEKSSTKTFHFLVANAKFMLDEEEHFQELMKERLRLFGERKREQDFWIVVEPLFLEQFPDITKRLKRPAAALVSTDALWITFMKLRLDRVLRGEIQADSVAEALKSNPADLNFEKPDTWTAPYSKYASGWWTPFLPPSNEA